MAVIGTWGDITFAVSRNQIKTFDGLKWDSGAKYSTHDRHLKEPLLEFTGTDVESMTFTMFFSAFLGVNPIAEVSKMLKAITITRAGIKIFLADFKLFHVITSHIIKPKLKCCRLPCRPPFRVGP